jgi:hypothetical protein
MALLVDDGRVLLAHRHPARRWYPEGGPSRGTLLRIWTRY